MKQTCKKGCWVIVLILVLLLIGPAFGSDTLAAATLDSSKGATNNNGIATIPLGTFQVIEESNLSAEQRAYAESVRKTPGVHNQGSFYVLAWGEKPNLGYQLEFVGQKLSWEHLKVYIRLRLPESGNFYANQISYPYLAGILTMPPYNSVSFLDADTGEELFTADPDLNYQSNVDGVSYQLTSSTITLKWGAQPSSGYSIDIDKIERNGQELHGYYSLVRPGLGVIQGTVVTFPSALTVIPEGTEPIEKVNLVRNHISELWTIRTGITLDKIWTIHFSQPINPATVNSRGIYVTEIIDGRDTIVPTTIVQGTDSTTFCVAPVNNYQSGRSYRLHVTQDVYSSDGQQIKTGIIMPFTTEK